jgi:enterochelin esterase family protein
MNRLTIIKASLLMGLNLAALAVCACTHREDSVTGNVASQLWAPLASAEVSVQGTNIKTKTDYSGNFSICANVGDTLVVSLPGYQKTKVAVGDEPINVTLNYTLKTVVVNPDNTITFSYSAPDAEDVQVCGNFFELENGTLGEGAAHMKKNSDGIWTYTTVPAKSELYRYEFIINGNYTIDAAAPYTIRDGEVLRNVFVVPGEVGDLTMVHDVPHGTVSKVWYPSSLGYDRRLSMYFPYGYEKNPERRYPVLYLLHGGGGDENEWLNLGRLSEIMDNLMAQGKVAPMIVVMPNGHPNMTAAPGENSLGYADAKNSKSFNRGAPNAYEATFNDVISFVDMTYRTIPDRAHRAIAGLSMGGGQACVISANYPDMFGYIGLFSAAVSTYDKGTSEMTMNFDEKLAKLFSLNPMYWIAIGDEDFLYQANKSFREKLDAAGYKYIYTESDCGHVWKNWRHYLTAFSQLLFK